MHHGNSPLVVLATLLYGGAAGLLTLAWQAVKIWAVIKVTLWLIGQTI